MTATMKGHPLRDLIPFGKTVSINSFEYYESHIEIIYLIDNHIHSLTRIHFPPNTLSELASLYSPAELRIIYCHIALFEGMKYCLIFPEKYDVSLIADGLNPEAFQLFRTIASRAWTQHMYENDVENYFGPEIISTIDTSNNHTKFQKKYNNDVLLCASGGGKDSFLVMKLLEKSQIPFAVFQHARSEYGRFDLQHDIQRRILKYLPTVTREHEISVLDDFTDGLLASMYDPNIHGECMLGHPCQVGWPEMIFESLPFVLLHGYSGFVLGNERSADATQATWSDASSRDVNHQWIKSNEASKLMNDYINEHLLADFSVFSLLKPIHDQRIYHNLSEYPEILSSIHSCNIQKPWCKKCSKCAYVWVNLVAIFGQQRLEEIFGVNLFDDTDLEQHWQELLGLSTHNAFECVGETWETRLAFYRCVQQGCKGKAITQFDQAFLQNQQPPIDWEQISARYNSVHDDHIIPDEIYLRVKKYL